MTILEIVGNEIETLSKYRIPYQLGLRILTPEPPEGVHSDEREMLEKC